MMKCWMALVGCAASIPAAFGDGDKPALMLVENAVEVVPERIARVRMEDGHVERVSDWMDYSAFVSRGPSDDLVFDCYYTTGTCDGGYWFLGTSYCNVFLTEDMTLHPDTIISVGLGRVDLAWYWGCGAPPGIGVVEDCEVVVLTQESIPCETDSFDYSGWILDYGTLSCGYAYYSYIDLGGQIWVAPEGGVGSYTMMYTTSDGGALATCAQPLLWGTGDARGDPDAPGTQGPAHFADSNADGEHTDEECSDYSLGICPDPLAAAIAFWGELAENGCDYANCDGNDVVDTRDFTCFFNQWVPKNDSADCDGNGVVDTRDFTCFLNQWVQCRG